MDRRAARSRVKAPRRRIFLLLGLVLLCFVGFGAVCLYVPLLPSETDDADNGERAAAAALRKPQALPNPEHLRDPCRARNAALQHVTASTFRRAKGTARAPRACDANDGACQSMHDPTARPVRTPETPRRRSHPPRWPAVLEKKFQQAVWHVTAPRQRDVERFVISNNWEAYAPADPVPPVTDGSGLDVVLAVQCSPDRCDLPPPRMCCHALHMPVGAALRKRHQCAACACRLCDEGASVVSAPVWSGVHLQRPARA